VPGGYATSSCGNVRLQPDLFPAEYRGNSFICDRQQPHHRDVLVPKGAIFSAQRREVDCEFLASNR